MDGFLWEHDQGHRGGLKHHEELLNLDVASARQPPSQNITVKTGPPRQLAYGPVELLETSCYVVSEIVHRFQSYPRPRLARPSLRQSGAFRDRL
jgi:hypothetical protein